MEYVLFVVQNAGGGDAKSKPLAQDARHFSPCDIR